MKYSELLNNLMQQRDEKFAAFSKSLSNSDYKVIGVKNPALRTFIKEHLADEELKIDDFQLGEYLEIDFIYFGLGLSRLKTNKEKLDFLFKKIKYAKSWAITDTACTYFKKLSFDEYFDFFLKTYESKFTYERRMAYVLGLKVYRDKNILKILSLVKENEEYMVMMAEAWLLATIAIEYPDEVSNYLVITKDISLKRKTISKISDSFRFSAETKNKFKELRRNI